MTSAIETSGLSKTYGAVTAVAGLDLRVEPGQIFAFLGPNGAGKSTTIRMLLALQRPAAGKAAVDMTYRLRLRRASVRPGWGCATMAPGNPVSRWVKSLPGLSI
jgi:ABC-type multidrug transport system ATPase subunit